MNQFSTLHPYWLVISALIFALIPIFIGVCTSYLKLSIVFGMLKSGLGLQHTPSTLVVMALSLSLSIFIMTPVIEESLKSIDLVFKLDSKKSPDLKTLESLNPVLEPWKNFMQQHAGLHEKEILSDIIKDQDENSKESGRVLIPAFLLTELKEAFSMGFILLLPFLVIDLIVANILAGMGMYMLSPAMISLPLKLLFFVLSDGWLLLSRSLILSYNM